MNALIKELRYAARTLARMRVTAAVAIVTLALGIGATTTIFSVVYAALLRAVPFPEPGRLVMLYTTRSTARTGEQRLRWSMADIAALGPSTATLEDIGSFTSATINLTGDGDPEQIFGEVASPGYFQAARVTPRSGRLLLAGDDNANGVRAVALISARLWRRRFGSDPAILGRTIDINQVPLTIVGVLPDDFSGLSGRADVWFPPAMAPLLTYSGYLTTPQHFINVIGRVKRGVSIAQAQAEIATIGPRVVNGDSSADAEPATWGAILAPIGDARIDASQRRSSLLLFAAVACLLLIACVNVASVLLARARTRRREIAVRLALGASRARIVRQLLAESVLLAAIGGAAGSALSV